MAACTLKSTPTSEGAGVQLGRPLVLAKFAATVFLFLTLLSFAASARSMLPAEVAAELRRADIPLSATGIVVWQRGKPRPVLDINSEQAMNPASVMKLVTTWAALELLGPAHTWVTKAYVDGTLADGTLDGDLILQGSGDPKFTQQQLWLLLRQLRARGIRNIRGDLVLDRSFYTPAGEAVSFDGKPLRPYNVTPDALLINFKALHLTLVPNGQKVSLLAEPQLSGLDIDNQIQVASGECGEWKEALRAEQTESGGRYRLSLTGDYPAACGEKPWSLGIMPHRNYVDSVFRDLWRELGGNFSGTVRDGLPPASALPIAAIESPTLAEIVRDINKYSNNVMARQLFLSLDRHMPATEQGAANAVRQWLSAKGLVATELVLDNGSGLSRHERISPATLVRLLRAAADSPLMPEFVSSLPLSAVDGTMKKRLVGHGSAGHAHIKTGTLAGVMTLAGYVLDARGREMMVVFFVNHPRAQYAGAAQDALLRWVFLRR